MFYLFQRVVVKASTSGCVHCVVVVVAVAVVVIVIVVVVDVLLPFDAQQEAVEQDEHSDGPFEVQVLGDVVNKRLESCSIFLKNFEHFFAEHFWGHIFKDTLEHNAVEEIQVTIFFNN